MVSWDVVPVPDRAVGARTTCGGSSSTSATRGTATAPPRSRLVADAVRAAGGDALYTSCGQGEGSPQPFYEGLGFVPTGEVDSHGEVHLALDLTTGASR